MTPQLPSGIADAVSSRPLGGGSICDVWWVRLADGREVVVKRTPYPAEVEVDGLRALAAAGGPVPAVLGADEHLLVVEYVTGPPDWAGLGRRVARMHGRDLTEERGSATFGWDRDNLIGTLHQPNDPHPHWPTFYAERRIRPLLDAPALPGDLRRRLSLALDGPLLELLDTDPPPSLVHGDLWNGNVVGGRWLIDPAVHRADRELDLAFAELFGGFPPAFRRGYDATWAPAPGWQARQPALQLYHLLVHVALFGSGYAGAVGHRLDALGW